MFDPAGWPGSPPAAPRALHAEQGPCRAVARSLAVPYACPSNCVLGRSGPDAVCAGCRPSSGYSTKPIGTLHSLGCLSSQTGCGASRYGLTAPIDELLATPCDENEGAVAQLSPAEQEAYAQALSVIAPLVSRVARPRQPGWAVAQVDHKKRSCRCNLNSRLEPMKPVGRLIRRGASARQSRKQSMVRLTCFPLVHRQGELQRQHRQGAQARCQATLDRALQASLRCLRQA